MSVPELLWRWSGSFRFPFRFVTSGRGTQSLFQSRRGAGWGVFALRSDSSRRWKDTWSPLKSRCVADQGVFPLRSDLLRRRRGNQSPLQSRRGAGRDVFAMPLALNTYSDYI